jgi:general secretion pathway protein G
MRGQRGAGVLQFSFVIVIIGVLMVILLDRVDFYRELAEKTAMEQLAREMGWALRLRAAELMLANRNDEIGGLDGVNPIHATEMQVANYAGAGTSAQEASVAGGRWYFNNQTRELVYFPELTSNFVREGTARPRIAWRAIVVQQATQAGGRLRPVWVRFELTRPYRWFEQLAPK